jgi:hypothetical protein
MSNPNTSFNKPSDRSGDDIEREVASILKRNKNKSSYQIMEELKTKYKDDEIIDSIMKKYNEKMKRVKKLAEKIRERLHAKHPNLSQKEYIEKVTQYKKKYDFDDSEMNLILKLLFLDDGSSPSQELYETNITEMSKALGFQPASWHMSGRLRVSKDELEYVNLIKQEAAVTRDLHHNVTIQSVIYDECASTLYNHSYDSSKINMFSFVHPVIAALFIPKFEVLDQHMLLASIAQIVDLKHEGHELRTLPEYELYWDICTDPSETACVNKTKPFTDLLARVQVQKKLWESVLNLRQGKFYLNDLSSFILAIDQCRASVFDAADLAYVKDEGTILRKLFAAFSFRPTIVQTVPYYGITQTYSNISQLGSIQITTLPMITFRIPMGINRSIAGNKDLILDEALNQQQFYIHHRQITVKQQSILYSREILVFYVHRRFQTINYMRLTKPWEVAALPVTMSQFERLQTTGIDFKPTFHTSTQTFNIKSGVAVETRADGHGGQIIVSCSALIRCCSGRSAPIHLWYNPLDLTSEPICEPEENNRCPPPFGNENSSSAPLAPSDLINMKKVPTITEPAANFVNNLVNGIKIPDKTGGGGKDIQPLYVIESGFNGDTVGVLDDKKYKVPHNDSVSFYKHLKEKGTLFIYRADNKALGGIFAPQ